MKLTGATDLDDFISRELQLGNVHCITSHEIAVQNTENRFMSNDEEVIMFTFQLEDDGLKTNGKVMV